jgi:hypothetical protein
VAKLTLNYHCQVRRKVFNSAMRARRAIQWRRER